MNVRSWETTRTRRIVIEVGSSRSMAARSRWLVGSFEQQQVGLPREHLGQFEPAALAARQRGHRAAKIARG